MPPVDPASLLGRSVRHHPFGPAEVIRVVGWWYAGDDRQPLANLYLSGPEAVERAARVSVNQAADVVYVGRPANGKAVA